MIEKIIETLASPNAWTKGHYARTSKGRAIGPKCENAECFCMLGAIVRAGFSLHVGPIEHIHKAIRLLFPLRTNKGGIPAFNDHPDTKHDDVLLVLTRARDLELAGE